MLNKNHDIIEKYRISKDIVGHILVEEILDVNCYGVLAEELANGTIIDIGANIGVFSVFALINGAKQVYSFEPDYYNYQKLLEFTSGFNNIKSINLAVSRQGLSQVYINGFGTICKTNENGDGNLINCISLEELLKNIPEDDLVMKLDCEGAEYDIIFTCSKLLLKRFKYIYTEVHNNLNCNCNYNCDMFKKFMNDIGFTAEITTPIAGMWYPDESGKLDSHFVPFPRSYSNENIKFIRN